MNKKRSETNQLASLHMVMLLIVALLLATGGVMHAYMKNRQIVVAREIDTTHKEMETSEENMKMVQVKIDRKLNRHMIRVELADRGSSLQPIPSRVIEVVNPAAAGGTSVAQTTP